MADESDPPSTMQAIMDINLGQHQLRQQQVVTTHTVDELARRVGRIENSLLPSVLEQQQETQQTMATFMERQIAMQEQLMAMHEQQMKMQARVEADRTTRDRDVERKRKLDVFVKFHRPKRRLLAVCEETGIPMYKSTRVCDFAEKLLPFYDKLEATGKL